MLIRAFACMLLLTACATPKPTLNFKSGRFSSIIRLHTRVWGDGNTPRFFCSATVISDRYAITAAHCVDSLMETDVHIYSQEGIATGTIARPVAVGRQIDYAIITGDFRAFQQMKLETSSAAIVKSFYYSKSLHACGYPGGGKLFCHKLTQVRPMVFSMAAKAAMWPGMSGGPVVDLETNKLIGVNSAMTDSEAIFAPLIEIFKTLGIEN